MFQRLVDEGLVKEKKYPNGLSVFKYSRQVFYDALWNTDPLLLEARGMVLNEAGEKVIWPFTKVFNHGENGTDCALDKEVRVVEKVNGFMGAARWYKDELIVSTTGTLDSEYATMARKWIEQLDTDVMLVNCTYLFEICDPEDPHIVDELPGAYLIGVRDMLSGEMFTEAMLDLEALHIGARRPTHFLTTFQEAIAAVRVCQKEGYMIIDESTGIALMKIKSPHYLAKKFLMRMSKNKVGQMFEDQKQFLMTLDEEFYPIVAHITNTFTPELWQALDDQERRAIIEEFFNEAA